MSTFKFVFLYLILLIIFITLSNSILYDYHDFLNPIIIFFMFISPIIYILFIWKNKKIWYLKLLCTILVFIIIFFVGVISIGVTSMFKPTESHSEISKQIPNPISY